MEKLLFAMAVALMLAAQPGKAQSYSGFSFENDILDVLVPDSTWSNDDEYYTNGVTLTHARILSGTPKLGRFPLFFPVKKSGSKKQASEQYYWFQEFIISQLMYTPRDIEQESLQPNDRPFAGLLMASVGYDAIEKEYKARHHFRLRLGVSGKLAFAGKTQTWVHNNITDSPEPKGWDTQVPSAFRFQVEYFTTQRLWTWKRLHLFSNFSTTQGNTFSRFEQGLTLIQGSGGIIPLGPLTPTFVGEEEDLTSPSDESKLVRFRVVTNITIRESLYNFTFGGSEKDIYTGVDPEFLVFDYVVGAELLVGPYLISYRQIMRSKEFSTGRHHAYGSLSLTRFND